MRGSLRIIAGSAKGLRLQSVPGDSTRPITDRTKEALFSILGSELIDATFLDLFAGTGSVGIEALSRGAEKARMLDIHPKAIKTLQQNLAFTKLEDRAEVVKKDAFTLLGQRADQQFDYIYIAPPQYKEMWITAIQLLDKNPDWMVEDAWVIVQIHPREYQAQELVNLSEFDQRKYGSTLLVFYERTIADVDR